MRHSSSNHQHYPLQGHPEFSVIHYSGYREYRLENRKLVTTSKSRRWISYTASSFIVASLSIGYRIVSTSYFMNDHLLTLVKLAAKYYYPVLVASLLVVLNSTLFQVLYGEWRLAYTFVEWGTLIRLSESVIVLPPHGIQLETHRGPFPSHPTFSIKRFIPASKLSEVVINEGLRGWNVLFYLVAMWHTKSRGTVLEVAYQVNHPIIRLFRRLIERPESPPRSSDPTSSARRHTWIDTV